MSKLVTRQPRPNDRCGVPVWALVLYLLVTFLSIVWIFDPSFAGPPGCL